MDISTIIAFASLGVAVLSRPIEKGWDRLFKMKSPVIRLKGEQSIFDLIFFAIVPAAGLAYMYFFEPFTKSNIIGVGIFAGIFTNYPNRRVMRFLWQRIQLLEDVLEEEGLLEEDTD